MERCSRMYLRSGSKARNSRGGHTMRLNRFVHIPLPLLLFFPASCELSGRTCSAAGAMSGASFILDQIVDDAPGPFYVHACVGGYCATDTINPQQGTQLTVDDPLVPPARSVIVELQIQDPSKRTIFDATKTIQLHRIQPNGASCPPTAYVASVVATSDGRLEQLPSP